MQHLAFKNQFKILLSILTIVVLTTVSSTFNPVHAQLPNCNYATSGPLNAAAPTPIQIVCPFIRIMNGLILVVGVIFTILIVYGGIKIAMSLGDPKGIEMGKNTWTYTIIGLVVVLGFFTIILITMRLFGITNFSTPTDAFVALTNALRSIFEIGNGTGTPIVRNYQ